MPLPAPNTPWPPTNLAHAYTSMREHAAWYAGDIDEIRAASGGGTPSHFRDGVPHEGGLRGWFSRAFWGRPLVAGEERTALHIPIAANLATLSNDLLNAEPPVFTVAGEAEDKVRTATEERLDLIWNSPDGHLSQIEAGELTAALGGTYWIADWDPTGRREYVFPRAVDADTAVPKFRGTQLVEVTFWTRIDRDKKTYRHLEHHESGVIIHALYETKDSNTLGTQVSLSILPETEPLTHIVGAVLDGYSMVIPTHIDRLTAVYEPNIRKSRRLRRRTGALAAWGRSDFEGIEPMFHSFDETWSSWMLDIKNGRSRIYVPKAYLENAGRGQGSFFDAQREVYAMVDGLPTGEVSKNISAQQFEIRVDEHERTAYNLKKEILQAAGYSLSSYGEHSDQSGVTATEVNDRRSDTERTRDKKIRYAAQARTLIASVCLELDGLVFRGKGGRPGVEVAVEFPDVSQVDIEKEVRIISLLDAASAISMETKIRRANPDWDDIRVGEEVQRVQTERGLPAPDPATFVG